MIDERDDKKENLRHAEINVKNETHSMWRWKILLTLNQNKQLLDDRKNIKFLSFFNVCP